MCELKKCSDTFASRKTIRNQCKNGSWDLELSCMPLTCSSTDIIENGEASCPEDKRDMESNNFLHGTVCDFQCLKGHKKIEGKKLECVFDAMNNTHGKWTNPCGKLISDV